MVNMFIDQLSYLLPGHFAKERMYKGSRRLFGIALDKRNPVGFFGCHITITGYFKRRDSGRIEAKWRIILQYGFYHRSPKYAAHKNPWVRRVVQYHLLPKAAVFDHLVNIHFAPLRGAFLI